MEESLLKTQKQLIETQMELLRYQYREICGKLSALQKQTVGRPKDDEEESR